MSVENRVDSTADPRPRATSRELSDFPSELPNRGARIGTDAKNTKILSRRTATALQWISLVFGLVAEACLCRIGLWSDIPSDLIQYTMQGPTLSVVRAADRRRDNSCYAPIQAYARCYCQPLEAPSFVVCRLPHHGVKEQQD